MLMPWPLMLCTAVRLSLRITTTSRKIVRLTFCGNVSLVGESVAGYASVENIYDSVVHIERFPMDIDIGILYQFVGSDDCQPPKKGLKKVLIWDITA